jgi:hypothetical protein
MRITLLAETDVREPPDSTNARPRLEQYCTAARRGPNGGTSELVVSIVEGDLERRARP